ncbi:TetR/AcrR family transcriptional regulator [Rhodococcus qingshengii]|uniref:TetR/AcrR family transcriptional regulator n=1 Tax=Rhodococcus qingshengii TaxID=334542 RepID=UPI001BEBB413|nr:TetR/AcrR family transcriptional regulator [Rhodococcus qingshengii]MBT2273805.1 helix-turn-helix transcriptional regulator [Rhodococcus qingshengii]
MTVSPATAPVKLPRGPHGLTREEVLQSQSGRLCWAAIQVVAEHGYLRTTVADIVASAGVSRRTFYELFDGKEDCFVGGFELAVTVVNTQLGHTLASTPDRTWKGLLRGSLDAYLALLSLEPAAARALHVETLAAGNALVEPRRQMQKVFADRMCAAQGLGVIEDGLPEQPEGMFDLLIGGIDDRIRECLLSSEAEALPALGPLLFHASCSLFGADRL